MDINSPELVTNLLNGGVGVLPTDTLYGIACLASDEKAVARLYSLKSRENKPGTIIAASVDQLVELGLKRRYLKPVEHYWPGAISIEIPHQINYLNQSTGRQAFRIAKDTHLVKILEKTGPLLTSSANLPGEPEANNIGEARDYFGNKVDFYVDGGDLSGRKGSTIIRIVDDAVEILRQGAVKINEAGEIIR